MLKQYKISEKLFADIQKFIDDNYEALCLYPQDCGSNEAIYQEEKCVCVSCGTDSYPDGLDDIMEQFDESFSQMLLRKIDEKGMKDRKCL